MAKGNLTIDKNVCKGCGLCVSVCPKQILILDTENLNTSGYTPASVTDMDACIACASCARICPDVAITIEKID